MRPSRLGLSAPDTRRLLIILLAGVLVSAGGLVWLEQTGPAGAQTKDNPSVRGARPAVTTTTSTTAGAGAGAPTTARPIDVPEDPYAEEP
ncbi:MAG: hypothetical protein QOI20_390, partial [Acidimicrobiaceae bacterium]|nr:hypothetical protein [Acidimicrobiaceae bacterium]